MATTDTPFRAADLIGSAGVGANGEKLIATLDAHYPPVLKAALLKRENEKVPLNPEEDFAKLAEILGVDRVEDATVRGGDRYVEDAVVTFVVDDDGVPYKGCLPYPSFRAGTREGLVSQPDEVQQTLAAQQHAESVERASNAPSTEALLQRIAALEAQAAAPPVDPEPVEGFARFNVEDATAAVANLDLAAAAAVLAFETRHKNRKAVVAAAEERLRVLAAPQS